MNDPSDEYGTEHWDDPLFDSMFLVDHKADYIRKPKDLKTQSQQHCIICLIIEESEHVKSLEIYRNDIAIVFLNIYPYTSGHLMISPLRHVKGYDELNGEEMKVISYLVRRSIIMLKHFGSTESFNVGWNQGQFAGGSIAHFHTHVVPRYKNDINFVDIIARSRPVIQSLRDTEQELKKYQPFLAGEKSIDDIVS